MVKDILTCDEAAEYANVSSSYIHKARMNGDLPYMEAPVRIWRTDLEMWMRNRQVRAAARYPDKWGKSLSPLTIGEMFERYAQDKVKRRTSNNEKVYWASWRNLREHFHYEDLVRNITPSMVDEYTRKRMSGEIGPSGPVKSSTVRRELVYLVAAINHAARYKLITPEERPWIPLPPESVPRDRWLSKEEAEKLLHAARFPDGREPDEMPDGYIFTQIGLNTAARKSAITELRWDQIDFENKMIYFQPSGKAKTKKRRATVPINETLEIVLIGAWNQRTSDEYVFGEAARRRAVGYQFKKAVKQAGLEKVTAHTLRHTYGTWAAQRGVPIWKIAGVMGDTVDTAVKHYLHHSPDELRDAV